MTYTTHTDLIFRLFYNSLNRQYPYLHSIDIVVSNSNYIEKQSIINSLCLSQDITKHQLIPIYQCICVYTYTPKQILLKHNIIISMEQQKQEIQIQNFAQIFEKNSINLLQFKKVCEEDDYKIVIDFIETILRFFVLRQKPGRQNPLATFNQRQVISFFDQLKKLKQRFEFTIYELKIEQLIDLCKIKTSFKLPQPTRQIPQLNPQKVEQILQNSLLFDCQFKYPKLLFNYAVHDVFPLLSRKILSINDHDTRYQVVLKSLKFVERVFHPVEVSVQISKNTLIETRVFKAVYETQFLKKQSWAVTNLAPIINQSLLCPSDMKIQGLLLKILKRLYFLWGDCITGPLYLNLRNISLYCDDSPEAVKILKQSSIFSYKLIKQKSDIKLCDMVESSEDLHYIKQNEYFSSKACAFPNQIGKTYDTINFQVPFWEYWHWIQNRGLWVYNVIIEKNNTMLSWKFWLKNYDIRFGIFKMNKFIKHSSIQPYQKQVDCKQMLKMEKYTQIDSKHAIKGHLFLKCGLYQLVFDNTYSMMRGKDIYYQIEQLQTIM